VHGDRLLTVAAVGATVIALGVAIGLRDRDALALTAALGISLLLYRSQRLRLLGGALLFLLFGNIAFWTITAVASNISHGEPIGSVILPGALAALSLVGVVGALMALVLPPPPQRQVRVGRAALFGLVAGAATIVVVAVAPSLAATEDPRPGDVVVKMKNSRFSPERLRAPAGTISLLAANPDLFWHTVTISDLDVDVKVPVGAVRRTTFTAPPGRYSYVCRVPGHTRMQGVLVVN
jgi:plastocyanin